MYKLFHCPNCNASLDLGENGAAIVRCDYCQSVVIVPESLRGARGVGKVAPDVEMPVPSKAAQPAKPALSEGEAVAKVTELARSGQQLEAMKLYRQIYSVSLKETKEAIEKAASGLPLPIPEIRREDDIDLPLEAAQEITHLVAVGQLDEATRLYRVTFGTSHVEAKTAVNQLVEGKSIDIARHRARQESQATAVRLDSKPTNPASRSFLIPGVIFFIILALIVAIALIVIFSAF